MCIINNTKNFIFIHVPRNAGTTITNFYSQLTTCRDIEIGGTAYGELVQSYVVKRFGINKHATAHELKAQMGTSSFMNFYRFGFSRNPYDRAISAFLFLRSWNVWSEIDEFKKEYPIVCHEKDINSFIQSPFFQTSGPDRIFMPQVHWLGSPGSPRKLLVDYVGRVEDIQESIFRINLDLQIRSRSLNLKHLNASESQTKKAVNGLQLRLDRRSKDILNKRYKIDFDLFYYEMQ